jgi:1-acyl-sn-glycerol-3-phosphate acyltransferase
MPAQPSAPARQTRPLQPIQYWLLRPFIGYISFYLRRNFRALHLLHGSYAKELEGWPVLVCMNHPSWWDPLLALYFSQYFFPEREHYGPIAVEGLNKYQFFAKLGFFGIDPKTRAGAALFLQTGRAVLARNDAALWVTVQGQFVDARIRPLQIQGGVAHLAHTTSRFVMLPIALEYSFWVHPKPEAFAAVGKPIFVEDGRSKSTAEWTELFSSALEETQNTLAEQVQQRAEGAFQPVFQGSSGFAGIYDAWRAIRFIVSGRSLQLFS